MNRILSREDLLKIYERLKNGESTADVAAEYGISPNCVAHRLNEMNMSIKALRMEQHQAKVMEMYERYRQGATYDQIAQEYYYAGGNAVARVLFADNDLPRLGRPERRKAAYERERKP